MTLFETLNDLLLRMTWLDAFIRWLLIDVLGLNADWTATGIVQFFLYDTIKIFLLLSILIFILSYIQSYFPPERTRRILAKYQGIRGNILGALFGTLTPFCSCSSIPIFIGFTKAGLPLGVTFSFLISSPLVDLASFLILMSFLGWEIALVYVVVGIVLAVVGGAVIQRMNMETEIKDHAKPVPDAPVSTVAAFELTTSDRRRYAFDQVKDIIRRVWIYILIGVAIGAIIHNAIPARVIQWILGSDNFFNVAIATVLAIPMYADIFGTIPIAEALLLKGIGVGTVLAFMMAVTTLSIPSMVLLSNVIRKRLLITFITVVTIGILIIGYLFNAISFIF